MSRQKQYEREGRNTSSNDPKMLNSRVFIGNLASDKVGRQDIENLFSRFGKVLGVSLHKSYGFVQFERESSAKDSVESVNGHKLHGQILDVNLAALRQKKKDDETKSSETKKSETKKAESKSKDEDRSRRSAGARDRRSPHRARSPRGRSPHSLRRHYDDDYHSSHHRHRRERSFSPPPFGSHELEYRARLRELERLRGMAPHFRDPFYDPLGPPPPRDPYMPPRDPYFMREPFPPPPLPPPGRMRDPYGPPHSDPFRMGPPPVPPPHMDPLYERPGPLPPVSPPHLREREREREREKAKKHTKMVDMEIIVVNRQQKDYADLICRRVSSLGIVVDIVYLSPTVSLADALDDAASRGLLYAIIVTSQHELHHSVTLTILHGRNPQEHKNMPLEDAFGLVDRDFERYSQGVRTGRIPPRHALPQKQTEVSDLLSQAASGEQLNPNQLQQVIEALQKQKHSNEVQAPPAIPQLTAKDDIQRQQADLQAKILSLLGSSAVVPPSPSRQPPQRGSGEGFDMGGGSGRGPGNAIAGLFDSALRGFGDGVGASDGSGGGRGGRAYGVSDGGGRGFGGPTDNGGRGYGQGSYGSGF